MRAPLSLIAALLLAAHAFAGQATPSTLRQWREAHEHAIVRELLQLLSIPNVTGNEADLRRNAEALASLFLRRGFAVEIIESTGAPVVLATLTVPDARGVLTFYSHYDGSAVTPREWTRCGPFEPCLVSPTGQVSLDDAVRLDPQWRLYGRSSSDDKGPIVALLNAVDALRDVGIGPTWSLRVVLDGQEEGGGSVNFNRFVAAQPNKVRGDLALSLDGPRHPSGVPTVYFGVRGSAGVTLTVYGAAMDLHSGNYGNWAPDPSFRLGRLLASMKDDAGRVLIENFYDDVTPLTSEERRALDQAPNVEEELMRTFGVGQPELAQERLEVKLNRPTLSVQTMEAGGGFAASARSVVPAFASARLAIRLVAGLDPDRQNQRVVAHIRKQGYYVVNDRDPTPEERRSHPLLARVDTRAGTPASRSSMSHPLAAAVVTALTRDGVPPVRLPTLGGSLPFAAFSEVLKIPTVGISLVNFDNNQHGPDENLRLQNLWDSVELLANILTMPRRTN